MSQFVPTAVLNVVRGEPTPGAQSGISANPPYFFPEESEERSSRRLLWRFM